MTTGRVTLLTSPSSTPCGVEMFMHGLARAMRGEEVSTQCVAVSGRGRELAQLWSAMKGQDALIVSFPVVAWKKALLTPLIALAIARLRGAKTVVILHEWRDLHALRRAFLMIYLLLARTVMFSSPSVRKEFEFSWISRLPFERGIAPIPPNIAPPAERSPTDASRRALAERAKGKLILGHFGSIYPKKQSNFVLDVAQALQRLGHETFVVFIGAFVKATDNFEQTFNDQVVKYGLEESVLVTGYIQSEPELFALFETVDVFVYAFSEGLTSRRGSVLACLESGRPLFVNAPRDAREFDHHPVFRGLIDADFLHLLPRDATAEAFATAIANRSIRPTVNAPSIFDQAWGDAAAAVLSAVGLSASPGGPLLLAQGRVKTKERRAA